MWWECTTSVREADIGFTVSNRTNQGKWESSYFLSWQRRVGCTGGERRMVKKMGRSVSTGTRAEFCSLQGVDKDKRDNWKKGLLARKDIWSIEVRKTSLGLKGKRMKVVEEMGGVYFWTWRRKIIYIELNKRKEGLGRMENDIYWIEYKKGRVRKNGK